MILAENLKRRRLQKQWTQPILAEKAEVSKGYIYMLEAGEMDNPSLDILHKIATALDCTIADLIGDPKVKRKDVPTEIPESLQKFARHKRKAGEPLTEDDLKNLARTEFRGKRPETVDDWAYLYEFLKRTFD
jgi:transcriptional regulator with XRE-family HTH domain